MQKRGWISSRVDVKIADTDIPLELLSSNSIIICIFRDSSAVEQEAVLAAFRGNFKEISG